MEGFRRDSHICLQNPSIAYLMLKIIYRSPILEHKFIKWPNKTAVL